MGVRDGRTRTGGALWTVRALTSIRPCRCGRGFLEVDERLAQAAQAFARVKKELEDGHWHLRNWAEELGISEDEMFIEVDRRLHQPVAA